VSFPAGWELIQPRNIDPFTGGRTEAVLPEYRASKDISTNTTAARPMNRSLPGARNPSLALQTALNPGAGGLETQRLGWTFRIGDRAIQTENDYNRDTVCIKDKPFPPE
jgi:hypothetical protein